MKQVNVALTILLQIDEDSFNEKFDSMLAFKQRAEEEISDIVNELEYNNVGICVNDIETEYFET